MAYSLKDDSLYPLTDKKTKTTYWVTDRELKKKVLNLVKGNPSIMLSAVVNRISLFLLIVSLIWDAFTQTLPWEGFSLGYAVAFGITQGIVSLWARRVNKTDFKLILEEAKEKAVKITKE